MSFNLNLLPSRAKFQAQKINLQKKVAVFVWIFSGFWVCLLVLLFGFWLISKLGLENDKGEYKTMLGQYKTMSDSAIASEKLKYKAKLVGKVLDGRFEYGESMRKVGTLFGSDVTVDNMELREGGRFELSGTVVGGQGMDGVEEKVAEINQGLVEGVVSAKMTALQVANNIWEFDMEVGTK